MTSTNNKQYHHCMAKGCNKHLKEDWEIWFLTVLGELRSYCEFHYDRASKRLKRLEIKKMSKRKK